MLQSFLPISADSDFSIHNLPLGIFSTDEISARPGMALGNSIVHLAALQDSGLLKDEHAGLKTALHSPTLNALMECGPAVWKGLRLRVQELFTEGNQAQWNGLNPQEVLVEMQAANLHMPVHIGDYTDFYSSEYHAANVGSMFRDPQNPLLPNWKHIPVGYHGRSSSIVVSGTDFHRPYGQFKAPADELPSFGASKQVDMELETAFIISRNTSLSSRIGVDEAEDSIFGMLLFNDWSARDLQSWEYVPLGPFLGKNFCSSVSPWVVSMEALKPFRVPMSEKQEPAVLPYLEQKNRWTYEINLEAEFETGNGQKKTITRTNQKYLYWSMNQQLAHHTINGCPMRIGDLLASGTISGPDPDSLGCLLEITRRGQNPVHFEDGSQRNFMQDGDRITLRGYAEKDGIRVGFGEVTGKVLPALAF
jgi:fumarylacetoacetase